MYIIIIFFKGCEQFLAIANEEGDLIIQDTNKVGENSIIVDFTAHNNAIFDVAWNPKDHGHIATASGDQSVRYWKIDNTVELVRKFKGFTRSVKCVEFVPQNPNLLVTGSREGSIFLWDIRDPSEERPALAIRRAHTHSSLGGMY